MQKIAEFTRSFHYILSGRGSLWAETDSVISLQASSILSHMRSKKELGTSELRLIKQELEDINWRLGCGQPVGVTCESQRSRTCAAKSCIWNQLENANNSTRMQAGF